MCSLFIDASEGRLSVDKVKPCLFQPESRFHAKRKVSAAVKQPLTACITNMFPPLHWLTVIYINIFSFSNFSVRWAICSEVWNCSKQGFSVCPRSVSARGEQIFLIAQAGLFSFCWCKVELRIFWFFSHATLGRARIFWCHDTVQFLLPGSVTDTIRSTFICLQVH